MIDKFDKVFNESLTDFGIILYEQDPVEPVADTPVEPEPAVAPAVPVEDGEIDSNSLSVNLVELARKALLVDPNTIEQGAKGLLSQHVDMNNVEAIETAISEITSIESSVDAEPTITYNQTI
jgi:hypothetical protein